MVIGQSADAFPRPEVTDGLRPVKSQSFKRHHNFHLVVAWVEDTDCDRSIRQRFEKDMEVPLAYLAWRQLQVGPD